MLKNNSYHTDVQILKSEGNTLYCGGWALTWGYCQGYHFFLWGWLFISSTSFSIRWYSTVVSVNYKIHEVISTAIVRHALKPKACWSHWKCLLIIHIACVICLTMWGPHRGVWFLPCQGEFQSLVSEGCFLPPAAHFFSWGAAFPSQTHSHQTLGSTGGGK